MASSKRKVKSKIGMAAIVKNRIPQAASATLKERITPPSHPHAVESG